MADKRSTRRSVLGSCAAATLALAGCAAFGGGRTRSGSTPRYPSTSPPPTSSTPADATRTTAEAASTAGPTAAPESTSTAESTSGTPESERGTEGAATAAPAETTEPGGTPEPTPTSLPGDAVEIRSVDVRADRETATVTVTLRNVGDVRFSRVELRVDLFHAPAAGEREHVAHAYPERRFEGGFGPDATATLESDPIRLTGRGLDAPPREERLDATVALRRACTTDDRGCFLPGDGG